jgi:hypothetical protein
MAFLPSKWFASIQILRNPAVELYRFDILFREKFSTITQCFVLAVSYIQMMFINAFSKSFEDLSNSLYSQLLKEKQKSYHMSKYISYEHERGIYYEFQSM